MALGQDFIVLIANDQNLTKVYVHCWAIYLHYLGSFSQQSREVGTVIIPVLQETEAHSYTVDHPDMRPSSLAPDPKVWALYCAAPLLEIVAGSRDTFFISF